MTASRVRVPVEGVHYRPAQEVDSYYTAGAWLPISVGDAVREAARAKPEKTFLIAGGQEYSFAEFDRHTEILGAALLHAGFTPGERAIFQMGSIAETVIALCACYKAGIVPVCTLPQYREIEIGQLAEMSGATGYFVQADFSPSFDLTAFAQKMMLRAPAMQRLVVARGAAPAGAFSYEYMLASLEHSVACVKLASIKLGPEDVLTFQLSGGSTGVTKIIPRFHGEYLGQAQAWAKQQLYTENEIAIWPLPVIHNAAMLLIVLPAILMCTTIVLQDRFDLQMFLGAIEKYRVTYAGSIGPVAPRLLDFKDARKHFDLSSLRMFVGMDRSDAIEAHIGVITMNLYGITEGLLLTSSPAEPALQRFTTNGWPTGPLDQVRVLNPESEERLPPGQEGELCFFGPHSVRAYYNAPGGINKDSFTRDGFFRTGDIVRETIIGGKSCYSFLGRLKDNISRGNEKFAAEEVERLIVEHPAVLDAKVVAMPDRYLGERACAFIIPRPGAETPDVAALGQFLTARGLAKFKMPERIEAISEFPVTRVGKVDKMAMRKIVAEKLAGEATSASKAAS